MSITYFSVCVCVCARARALMRVQSRACWRVRWHVWRYLSDMKSACAVLYFHLWPLAPPHFLTLSHKEDDFRKKISKTFLILGRIQLDIVINVKTSSCKVPIILVRF